MTEKKKEALSRLGLIVAGIIWGTTFYLVKDTLQEIHPTTLVAARFILASVLAGGILLLLGKNLWRGFSKGIWLGVFLWLAFEFQTYGLLHTSASNSGFITGLYVPLVPILALFLFRIQPSTKHWVAIAVSVVGLWILTGGVASINEGDLLTLGTAVAVAVHLLLSDRYVRRDLDALALTFQQFTVVAVLSTIHAVAGGHSWPVFTANIAWRIGYLAIFASVLTIFLQTTAQKHLDAVRVALLLTLEPVFAALFAWTLGNEPWTAHQMAGGAVIITAMIISEV